MLAGLLAGWLCLLMFYMAMDCNMFMDLRYFGGSFLYRKLQHVVSCGYILTVMAASGGQLDAKGGPGRGPR